MKNTETLELPRPAPGRSSAWLDHFEPHMLIIAATRYFTGRMTIATCAFADELAKAWSEIPEETRNIIKRDLEDKFRRDDEARARGDQCKPLGMDCDRAAWEKVRAMWSNAEVSEPGGVVRRANDQAH
jgi:hypothetical protein